MDRWVGKVALVTGASAGIGNAIARNLAQNGMKVVACARNEQQLNTLAADMVRKQGPGEIFPYRCDVKDESQMLKMFEFIRSKFGTLHVCVNNAGLAHQAPILSGSTEEWKQILDVNVIALCIGCRESVKLMREVGVDDGHVININSLSGHRVGRMPMYSASKFAVTAISEGLRRELLEAKTHIRCTSISPGLVETQLVERVNRLKRECEGIDLYETFTRLQAEDIADAVMYVLQAPSHVNVNDIVLRSIEQAA